MSDGKKNGKDQPKDKEKDNPSEADNGQKRLGDKK